MKPEDIPVTGLPYMADNNKRYPDALYHMYPFNLLTGSIHNMFLKVD